MSIRGRALWTLLAGFLLFPPLTLAQDTVTTSPDACARWTEEAHARAESFWSEHRQAWSQFESQMRARAEAFVAEPRTDEESSRFWNEFWAHVEAERNAYRQRANEFHEEMYAGYRANCGDAARYGPEHYDYPIQVEAATAKPAPTTEPAYPDAQPAPAHPEYSEWRPSDECRAYGESRQQAARSLEERFRARWQSLQDERAAFEASGPHSDEQWVAFKQDQMDRERQLRSEMDAAFQQLHQEFPDRADCQAPWAQPVEGQPAEPARPGCNFESEQEMRIRFEERFRQREEEFRRLQQEKWSLFESRLKAEVEAFHGGNHTDEERAQFGARMAAARSEFHERMRAEEESFFRQAELEKQRFFAEVEMQCQAKPTTEPGRPAYDQPPTAATQPARPARPGMAEPARPGVTAYHAAHEEFEIQRLRCELEAQELYASFLRQQDSAWAESENTGRSDDRAFAAQMETDRLRFEITMRERLLECHRGLQRHWESAVGAELESARPHEKMGSWSFDEAAMAVRGKFVTLQGDPGTNTMHDIAVQGAVYIQTLATDSWFESDGFAMGDESGRGWLQARGEGVELRLHDNPVGLIKLRTDGPHAILLTIPDYLRVEERDNGWAIVGNEREARVIAHNGGSEWNADSRILALRGEAQFLVPEKAENYVLDKVANKHRDRIMEAVVEEAVGAEITVAADADGTVLDETLAYGDVEVAVEAKPDEQAVEVTLSSDTLAEGRTFVLNIESGLVEIGADLHVTYSTVLGSGEEVPGEIAKASSLGDILNPQDDEGPEYWIVEDEDGVQVLATIAHWSTHRIRVQSAGSGDGADESDGALSVPAPGLLLLLPAIGALARRRRD